MLRLLPLTLMLAPAILALGCLGTLQRSEEAAGIAGVAAGALRLPIQESRPHWFLRQEAGWLGAHRIRFGGRAEDEGLTVVRAAVFTDESSASAALARITPAYTYALWHSRMEAPPRTVPFPVSIPGDEVRITEYQPRLSPEETEQGLQLSVQLISLRAGRVVVVIESIGVPREKLAPVTERLVEAARALGASEP